MAFTCENHDPRVQKLLMQLLEGNKKFEDPLLIFTDLRYFPYYIMEKEYSEEKITSKLQMVFTCENHDPRVQTQLMQLMEGN